MGNILRISASIKTYYVLILKTVVLSFSNFLVSNVISSATSFVINESKHKIYQN